MDLVDPLFSLRLKRGFVRGEIRVLVPKELVGDLPGHQDPKVCGLPDLFAAKIHPDAGPYRCDVPGAQNPNHFRQRLQNVFPRHGKGGVLRADEFRCLLRVFQVDGVCVHANGKGADGTSQQPGADGADQAGV